MLSSFNRIQSRFVAYPSRYFSKVSAELKNQMHGYGITHTQIIQNPTVGELYEYAMMPEHRGSQADSSIFNTTITDTGALLCSSGVKMGRSPKERRIVEDDMTRDKVNWGKINIPLTEESFLANRQRAIDFMKIQKRIFVID